MAASRLSRLFRPSPSPSPSSSPISKPKSVRSIVRSLYKEPDLDTLVSSFKSCSADPRFRHKHNVYFSTVRRLVAARRLDSISEILEAQKLYPDITREGFAVRIISLYTSAGMLEQASATFSQLPSLGCPRTVLSFNALLSAYLNDVGKVVELFRSAEELHGVVPDTVSYNTVINALGRDGKVDEAMEIFRSMDESGVEPNVITFNTLLSMLYQCCRFDDADKMWDEMSKKNCAPSAMSFNAKLRALVNEGKTAEATEIVFCEMERRGVEPDGYSFTALIVGRCKDGDLEEAKKVFDEMSRRGCSPNRGTFQALVPKLCEAGELDRALALCMKSLKLRMFVTVEALREVVDALVENGRLEEGKQLVEKAVSHSFYQPYSALKMPSSCLVD